MSFGRARSGVVAGIVVVGIVVGVLARWPVAHADDAPAATSSEPDPSTPEGNPQSPDNWRYCAIDGFLSSCCGGTHTSCPPGTQMSTVTWLGTCRNPEDGKDYVISYNDCCGKPACGSCFVNRNERDRPVYVTPRSNDINWCMGTDTTVYNSTVAIVVGVAEGAGP